MMKRRNFLIVPALAPVLAACGFRPLYAPPDSSASGVDGAAARELAAIHVALIPERTGQLLRNALLARFERQGASGGSARYELETSYSVVGDLLGVRRDNAASRERLMATANWVLKDTQAQRRVVTRGVARAMDAYNILDNQFFASDLSSEAAQKRLAEEVAQQMATQLAVYFTRQASQQTSSAQP